MTNHKNKDADDGKSADHYPSSSTANEQEQGKTAAREKESSHSNVPKASKDDVGGGMSGGPLH